MFFNLFLFLGLAIGVLTLLLLVTVGNPSKIVKYFKTDGKGAGVGIAMFVGGASVLVILTTLLFPAKAKADVTWFNEAEVFIGLDQTKKLSPMCHEGKYSDRVTSNGGVRLNVMKTTDSVVRVDTHYIHHSCAVNRDDSQYDAVGVQLVYRFWSR